MRTGLCIGGPDAGKVITCNCDVMVRPMLDAEASTHLTHATIQPRDTLFRKAFYTYVPMRRNGGDGQGYWLYNPQHDDHFGEVLEYLAHQYRLSLMRARASSGTDPYGNPTELPF